MRVGAIAARCPTTFSYLARIFSRWWSLASAFRLCTHARTIHTEAVLLRNNSYVLHSSHVNIDLRIYKYYALAPRGHTSTPCVCVYRAWRCKTCSGQPRDARSSGLDATRACTARHTTPHHTTTPWVAGHTKHTRKPACFSQKRTRICLNRMIRSLVGFGRGLSPPSPSSNA